MSDVFIRNDWLKNIISTTKQFDKNDNTIGSYYTAFFPFHIHTCVHRCQGPCQTPETLSAVPPAHSAAAPQLPDQS